MKSIFAFFASSSLLALLVQVAPASAQLNEYRYGNRYERNFIPTQTNVNYERRRPVPSQDFINQPRLPGFQSQGFGHSSGSYFGW
jgi:hypothetical protein